MLMGREQVDEIVQALLILDRLYYKKSLTEYEKVHRLLESQAQKRPLKQVL